MFTHQGFTRTHRHNLQAASTLAFVAGLVNVAGFLIIKRLTTNVTGHFAYFIDEVYNRNFFHAMIFLGYILSFLLGAFLAGWIVERGLRANELSMYVKPVLIEAGLLAGIAIAGTGFAETHTDLIACLLLLTMGMQNSLITQISNAIVRTTHLTGLFTDLGIELSQLLFYHQPDNRNRLKKSIFLRFSIISFFFIGGIAGGLLQARFGIRSLLVGTVVLVVGLLYDETKIRVAKLSKRH